MDFSHHKKMEKLTQVSIRLPVSIREKARMIVANSSKEEQLTESDIYRFIIVNFFAGMTTNCSHLETQIVGNSEEST